jgi:hypothetical protein
VYIFLFSFLYLPSGSRVAASKGIVKNVYFHNFDKLPFRNNALSYLANHK